MSAVDGFRCAECEALFEEPDGPLYECSRCGQNQLEENRCEICNVFMAKIADTCCPECNGIDAMPAKLWRGGDDTLFDSEEAERRWIAGAPEREAQAERTRRQIAKWDAARKAENRQRNAELLPLLHRLRARIAETMPRLAASVSFQIEQIEREPAREAGVVAMLYIEELARLLTPELGEDVEAALEYDQPRETRDAHAATIRAAITSRLAGTRLGRIFDHGARPGSGVGFSMDEATDLLAAVGED